MPQLTLMHPIMEFLSKRQFALELIFRRRGVHDLKRSRGSTRIEVPLYQVVYLLFAELVIYLRLKQNKVKRNVHVLVNLTR